MSNNIFGGGGKPEEEFKDKVDTHAKALLNIVQRQKEVESNLELTNEKIELLDHNSIKNFRKLAQDVKSLRTDINTLKEEISLIKEFNSKVSKQMRLLASKDEIAKLERYIDLWNPMEFITREEMIKENKKLKKELEEIIDNFIKN